MGSLEECFPVGTGEVVGSFSVAAAVEVESLEECFGVVTGEVVGLLVCPEGQITQAFGHAHLCVSLKT